MHLAELEKLIEKDRQQLAKEAEDQQELTDFDQQVTPESKMIELND
jgi:hypothetical protein